MLKEFNWGVVFNPILNHQPLANQSKNHAKNDRKTAGRYQFDTWLTGLNMCWLEFNSCQIWTPLRPYALVPGYYRVTLESLQGGSLGTVPALLDLYRLVQQRLQTAYIRLHVIISYANWNYNKQTIFCPLSQCAPLHTQEIMDKSLKFNLFSNIHNAFLKKEISSIYLFAKILQTRGVCQIHPIRMQG